MKKTFFFSLLFIFSINLDAKTKCECGSYETAITSYSVDGEDCCKGKPSAHAWVVKYEQDPETGNWKPYSSSVITGSAGQEDCCPDV